VLYNSSMDARNLQFEIQEGYTLVRPKVLGPGELDHLPSYIESLLLQRKQDVVLSLENVETVFSSHLTAIVQVYRLLKSFNLKFIISDISPAVLNVMQMTQLDSLLPLFLTLQDYRDALKSRSPTNAAGSLDFDFSMEEVGHKTVVTCKGYMAFGEKVRQLQAQLDGKEQVELDLSSVGYMDTRVLIMIADLATRSTFAIRGASNVVRELFDQHRMQGKVEFLE